MARIVSIEIHNFRGISYLHWMPMAGINCLIGPGDSGKSTILDAIDWCLGARRSIIVSDADFTNINVDENISIEIALGDLDDSMKSLDKYGLYLRGFNQSNKQIEDEPGASLETILSVRLKIGNDLEPHWDLVSERAEMQGGSKSISWSDRLRIAPSRIGSYAAYHLSWQYGSVLTRLCDETASAPAAFASASRSARASFGEAVGGQLQETLTHVQRTADRLGVNCGERIRALLDPHSISLTGGTIALHSNAGVPLRSLGSGSSRLLVSGLQHSLAKSIALVDEVEFGLEPHRIARLLAALGSKDSTPKLQVFMTTHSPVVLRELASEQLHVVRVRSGKHHILSTGEDDGVQGTLRSSSEAFFGESVVVCEGATEVGMFRGHDLYRDDIGLVTMASLGVVPLDANGVDKIYRTANSLLKLGYRVAVLRDDDKRPDACAEAQFLEMGGMLFKWTEGKALEDELFYCIDSNLVVDIIMYAAHIHSKELVSSHLSSAAGAPIGLDEWLVEINEEKRLIAARAAKCGSWLKRISIMEAATRKILSPNMDGIKSEFVGLIDAIVSWAGVRDARS